MSISNYAELKILDHLTGRAAWSMPTTVYIKLHTADSGEDGTTAPATNAQRIPASSWAVAASGAISTSATLTWSSVSTTETYTHWSAWDNATAGNCLWTGALSSAAAVSAGDTFQITLITLSLD